MAERLRELENTPSTRFSWSARCSTGPGFAMLINVVWNGPNSSLSSLRWPTLCGRSADPDLPAGRAALPDRALRARPTRADAGRQPLGRRRQGDGARRPRAAAGEASPSRPADHSSAAVDLLPIRAQPVADRSPADARSVLPGHGGQADGRRRLCPGHGRDGPNIPIRRGPDDDSASDVGLLEGLRMGVTVPRFPAGERRPMVSRLPGQALSWRILRAAAPPAGTQSSRRWRQRWDPYGHVLLAARG